MEASAMPLSSKPRAPKNFNDDQKVDEYNFRLAQYEEDLQNVNLSVALAGTSHETRIQSAVGYLDQIVRNIVAGDAVYKLSEVHLFVSDPGLSRKNSIILLPSYRDEAFETSDDYKTFASLVGTDFGTCSDLLSSLMDSHKSFSAAVPAIISAGLATGKIMPGDKDRLTSLWTTWVKGVGWAKCRMSMTNRPSLASWNGWPWEADQIMARCLMGGLPAAASSIITTDTSLMPYEAIIEDPDLAFPLWHFESGPLDVSDVLLKARVATQALMDEDEEKGAGVKTKPAKKPKASKPKAKKPRHE
jgi:hypothetical protein